MAMSSNMNDNDEGVTAGTTMMMMGSPEHSSNTAVNGIVEHPSMSFQYGSTLACGAVTTQHTKRILPVHYEPGEYDVVCGRGSKCFNHLGNQRFRTMIDQYLPFYSSASCNKHEKTTMIIDIVAKVRHLSTTDGGFVKKNPTSGRYYEVGDFLAREKTSQAFRDAMLQQQQQQKKQLKQQNSNQNLTQQEIGSATTTTMKVMKKNHHSRLIDPNRLEQIRHSISASSLSNAASTNNNYNWQVIDQNDKATMELAMFGQQSLSGTGSLLNSSSDSLSQFDEYGQVSYASGMSSSCATINNDNFSYYHNNSSNSLSNLSHDSSNFNQEVNILQSLQCMIEEAAINQRQQQQQPYHQLSPTPLDNMNNETNMLLLLKMKIFKQLKQLQQVTAEPTMKDLDTMIPLLPRGTQSCPNMIVPDHMKTYNSVSLTNTPIPSTLAALLSLKQVSPCYPTNIPYVNDGNNNHKNMSKMYRQQSYLDSLMESEITDGSNHQSGSSDKLPKHIANYLRSMSNQGSKEASAYPKQLETDTMMPSGEDEIRRHSCPTKMLADLAEFNSGSKRTAIQGVNDLSAFPKESESEMMTNNCDEIRRHSCPIAMLANLKTNKNFDFIMDDDDSSHQVSSNKLLLEGLTAGFYSNKLKQQQHHPDHIDPMNMTDHSGPTLMMESHDATSQSQVSNKEQHGLNLLDDSIMESGVINNMNERDSSNQHRQGYESGGSFRNAGSKKESTVSGIMNVEATHENTMNNTCASGPGNKNTVITIDDDGDDDHQDDPLESYFRNDGNWEAIDCPSVFDQSPKPSNKQKSPKQCSMMKSNIIPQHVPELTMGITSPDPEDRTQSDELDDMDVSEGNNDNKFIES